MGPLPGHPPLGNRLIAGEKWDEYIAGANLAFNLHLESSAASISPSEIAQVPIRDYYNGQLRKLRKLLLAESIPASNLTMNVKLKIPTDDLNEVDAGTPDGYWVAIQDPDYSGGLFESKLSQPPEAILRRTLAAYALLAERHFSVDFDIGLVLSLDQSAGVPVLTSFSIGESDRQDCLSNIQRFLELLALRRSFGRGHRRRATPWSSIVQRPSTPPPSSLCKSCEFRIQCRPGGESLDQVL